MNQENEEFLRMMRLIEEPDENGVPSSTLTKTPVPPLHRIESDEQAEAILDELEDELQRLNVVVDWCDHFAGREAYRVVVENILEQDNLPKLSTTKIITHFPTYQHCKDCEREFEEDHV